MTRLPRAVSALVLANLDEVIRLRPDYVEAYHSRGSVWKLRGDTAKCEADWAKARDLGFAGDD